PGIRCAFGTRFGRPAWVCASGAWLNKDSAACHPSSPGEDQSLLLAAASRAEPLRAAGVSGCCWRAGSDSGAGVAAGRWADVARGVRLGSDEVFGVAAAVLPS